MVLFIRHGASNLQEWTLHGMRAFNRSPELHDQYLQVMMQPLALPKEVSGYEPVGMAGISRNACFLSGQDLSLDSRGVSLCPLAPNLQRGFLSPEPGSEVISLEGAPLCTIPHF